jgi:hypothetical protein
MQTLGCSLSAPGPEAEYVAMLTSTSQPAADARALHRVQRELVAASLLACPPRTTKPTRHRA